VFIKGLYIWFHLGLDVPPLAVFDSNMTGRGLQWLQNFLPCCSDARRSEHRTPKRRSSPRANQPEPKCVETPGDVIHSFLASLFQSVNIMFHFSLFQNGFIASPVDGRTARPKCKRGQFEPFERGAKLFAHAYGLTDSVENHKQRNSSNLTRTAKAVSAVTRHLVTKQQTEMKSQTFGYSL
jgi:hypothetical protein